MTHILKNVLAIFSFSIVLLACQKDIIQTEKTDGTASVISLSKSTLILEAATATDTVLTINWTKADFGFKSAVNYTVELVKTGSSFSSAKTISLGNATQLKYVGAVLNEVAIGMGIAVGTSGVIDIRIKSAVSDSVFIYSPVSKLTITTYQVAFPALLVRSGSSWVTPIVRTNGFVLTAPNYDGKYEGYVYLPNNDGWGGDALKLQDQSSGVQYGWGGTQTTMTAGSAGNLWFTPAPNYMKINADVNAGTVNFLPVKFFISGDHNSWSTSATPMIYNNNTRQWVATNVNFIAGNKFVFTSNGSYDLSYKINAQGKLTYSGPPGWTGSDIPAPSSGSYTVILDMSEGNGNYTYKIL